VTGGGAEEGVQPLVDDVREDQDRRFIGALQASNSQYLGQHVDRPRHGKLLDQRQVKTEERS